MITIEKEENGKGLGVLAIIIVILIIIAIITYQIIPSFHFFVEKIATDLYCWTTIPR